MGCVPTKDNIHFDSTHKKLQKSRTAEHPLETEAPIRKTKTDAVKVLFDTPRLSTLPSESPEKVFSLFSQKTTFRLSKKS